MTDGARNTDTQGIKVVGIMCMFCPCGQRIGIETRDEERRFIDLDAGNATIEACPSCHQPIEADQLQFSEEQKKRLHRAYQLIRSWAEEAE